MIGRGVQRELTIQARREDRFHALVGACLELAGSSGCGFQTFGAVGFSQTQDAQATAETLFRVRAGLKNLIDQRGGERTHRGRPTDQTLGRPFQVTLMRFGPVGVDGRMFAALVTAGVTGHTLAAMEDLDGHRGVPHIDFAMKQRIWNAVVVVVDFDVVVDMDAGLFPFRKRVGFGR